MRVKPPPAVVVRVLTKGDSSLVAPVCFPLPSAPRLPRSWYMPGAEPADTHLLLSVRLAARNAAASALAGWNDRPLSRDTTTVVLAWWARPRVPMISVALSGAVNGKPWKPAPLRPTIPIRSPF